MATIIVVHIIQLLGTKTMKRKRDYAHYNYANVTLTETADTVRDLAREREWSNSHAADYLIQLGAQTLKGLTL
jgi:hypothetical protein